MHIVETINYHYDPLYRLTSADYSTGSYYYYTYDSVGNRLTETTALATKNYAYDDANRLTAVDNVNYTWDANGNLLNDGVNSYVYDSANRLVSVSREQRLESSYTYNGLGDRLSVNGVQYTLDLNAGLTQVLNDGTNTYTYGLGRISQTNTSTEYFLGDALGSVRQLTAGNGDVTLAKSYDPYGNVTHSAGSGTSPFAYTGEQQDATGLTYLRARYYNPADGRFVSRDPSELERNLYLYASGNPINRIDPSGLFSRDVIAKSLNLSSFDDVLSAAEYDQTWGFDESWGFIAALLAAEPGDSIAGGRLELVGLGIPAGVSYLPPVRVDLDGNCTITFDGLPINQWC